MLNSSAKALVKPVPNCFSELLLVCEINEKVLDVQIGGLESFDKLALTGRVLPVNDDVNELEPDVVIG